MEIINEMIYQLMMNKPLLISTILVLMIVLAILIYRIKMKTIIITNKTKQLENLKKEQEAQKTKKLVSENKNELKFQEALKLFLNTCEFKFNFWFETKILPIYISKGPEHVTKPVLQDALDNFSLDVKACIHQKIYEKLFDNYFSDSKALDIFLKEYFYNKINNYEIKNAKINLSTQVLNEISKG